MDNLLPAPKKPKIGNNEINTVGPFTDTEEQRKLNRQLEVLYDELGFEDFTVVGSVALMIHCFASNLKDKTNCLEYDIGDIDMVTQQGYNTILEQKRDEKDRLFLLPKTNIKIKGKDKLDFGFPFHKGISLEYEKNDLKFEFDYIKPSRNLPPIDMYYKFSENPEKRVGILSIKRLKSEYKDAEEDMEMLNNKKKGKLNIKLEIIKNIENQQQRGGKRRSVKKSKNQKKSKRNNSTKKRRRTKKKKPSKN